LDVFPVREISRWSWENSSTIELEMPAGWRMGSVSPAGIQRTAKRVPEGFPGKGSAESVGVDSAFAVRVGAGKVRVGRLWMGTELRVQEINRRGTTQSKNATNPLFHHQAICPSFGSIESKTWDGRQMKTLVAA
jgi:hypothetical protein